MVGGDVFIRENRVGRLRVTERIRLRRDGRFIQISALSTADGKVVAYRGDHG